MTKNIFAFDTNDNELGEFFEKCKFDLEDYFKSIDTSIEVIKGNQLNDLTISLKLNDLNNFVFGAYSHGGDDCLVVSGTKPYLSDKLNINQFEGAFFYTFSCSSGKSLGLKLIENKCLCFIGYKKTVSVWAWELSPFVKTANYGMKLFFQDIDTDDIIAEMKEEYNNQIDKFYKNNVFVASILRDNRDALIKHGKNIKISSWTNS